MAVSKKTVTPAAKVEAPKTEAKKAAPTTPVKTETKTAVKEAEKAPVAKAEEKAPAKAEAKKPVEKKEPVKKETAKKAEPAKKTAELKSEISVQFGGKSYSQEDLLKIAKDVWKYDLKQEADDLTSVELYVKPEENMVYYVMNKEITGSFYI